MRLAQRRLRGDRLPTAAVQGNAPTVVQSPPAQYTTARRLAVGVRENRGGQEKSKGGQRGGA